MDQNDRRIIDELFAKLAEAERQAPEPDAESAAMIRDKLGRQPDAPYYMLQTIAVQQQALEALQQRVAELEQGAQSQSGGFLGRLFGAPPAAARPHGPSAPAYGAPHGQPHGQPPAASPWGAPRQGGFMAGAMQTAVGVAGGVLLGNALAGMLSPDEAAAEEAAPEMEDPDFGSDTEF